MSICLSYFPMPLLIKWFKETSQFFSRTSHIQDSLDCLFMVSFNSLYTFCPCKLEFGPGVLAKLLSRCCFVLHVISHQKSCNVLLLVMVRWLISSWQSDSVVKLCVSLCDHQIICGAIIYFLQVLFTFHLEDWQTIDEQCLNHFIRNCKTKITAFFYSCCLVAYWKILSN